MIIVKKRIHYSELTQISKTYIIILSIKYGTFDICYSVIDAAFGGRSSLIGY